MLLLGTETIMGTLEIMIQNKRISKWMIREMLTNEKITFDYTWDDIISVELQIITSYAKKWS